MPLTYRSRFAFALGTVLVGGVLLAPIPAEAATPKVTFTGGCGVLGVGASSTPSRSSIEVPAESEIDFVNNLGQAATLLVNGAAETTLRAGEDVTMQFHHGPVEVKMTPSCLLAASATPITVSVRPRSDGTPHASTVDSTPATAGPALASPSAPAPSGSPRSAEPTPSGYQSEPAVLPTTGDPTDASGLGVGSTDPVTGDAVAISGTASAPSVRHGVSAVLLLVAVICVVGSSIGAFRAILAQRASRIVSA